MSIYYSGTFKRSSGVVSSIVKHLKQVNLKPVKKIQVQFDPFHENAVTARDFLYYISTPKVTNTNLNCIVKPIVVCDRSEPEIKVDLSDSSVLKFKANNLTVLEILQLFNKHISSKVPVENISASSQTQKLEKKKLKKK
ncbi:PREDICTED: 39S ribosomal protein L53, mitochondrial [Nicrophorus vespilloides]|uniref:Large ribosomal subunit protein mL53 n=1 Tax=Nicrophorus vespilloides TaxID=110193 RepID=A0ABM1N8I7_NICVS|nr:PREDICTED: 39S ribosomal protein L53, mitochondrial [Nicrophorus vespilloides]